MPPFFRERYKVDIHLSDPIREIYGLIELEVLVERCCPCSGSNVMSSLLQHYTVVM